MDHESIEQAIRRFNKKARMPGDYPPAKATSEDINKLCDAVVELFKLLAQND